MNLRSEPVPEDLEAIRRWFKRLSDHVQAVDYEGARPIFADDMIAFGTFTDFMIGQDKAEREQWRNVWGTIRRFRWRLEGVHGIVSADRLTGIGMAIFDSDGFLPDGTTFDRRGRATVTFARSRVGDPWVATHTHMSLFRGTPDRSHGNFTGP
ncbi:MAG: nuclear transport factor 2 family protein [Alphaproteobacteria bacterium]|nr:nuclear transport factor 2 family protein [Alphaproteobacteria bacterium]